jgi:AcrR family transcriptional regulator
VTAQRADARRNYARILAVAEQEVAATGVGSATVRRHFPSKSALLTAVFRERIESLCAKADELAELSDARAALLQWLSALTDYASSARGLASALALDEPDAADHAQACSAQLTEAAEPLRRRAADTGVLTSGVTVADLLTLTTGIALATEHHQDPAAEANRLLGLAINGISPPERSRP